MLKKGAQRAGGPEEAVEFSSQKVLNFYRVGAGGDASEVMQNKPLQMRKSKLREGAYLSQCHTAR